MKKNFRYILLIVIIMFSFNSRVKADTMYCAYKENNFSAIMVEIIDNKEVKYYNYSVSQTGKRPIVSIGREGDSTARPKVKIKNGGGLNDFKEWNIDSYKLHGVVASYNACPDFMSVKYEGYWEGGLHYYFSYERMDNCENYEVCNQVLYYSGVDRTSNGGNGSGNNGGTSSSKNAKELSCLYEGSPSLGFTQDSSGVITYYINNKKNAKFDSENWVKTSFNLVTDSGNFSNGSFTNCPAYSRMDDDIVFLYDGESSSEWQAHIKDWLVIDPNNELVDSKNSVYDFKERVKADTSSFKISSSQLDQNCGNLVKGDEKGNIAPGKQLPGVWLIEPDTDKYNNSCLYFYTTDDKCKLFQVSFNETDLEYASTYDLDSKSVSYLEGETSELIAAFNGSCPINIYEHIRVPEQNINNVQFSFEKGDIKYSLGNSLLEQGKIPLIIPGKHSIESCEDLLSSDLIEYIKIAKNLLFILVPIIILGLSVVDFARGIFSGEDEMKKIQSKFVRRIIFGVGFFLIPIVLSLLLNIANGIWPGIDTTFCGIL